MLGKGTLKTLKSERRTVVPLKLKVKFDLTGSRSYEICLMRTLVPSPEGGDILFVIYLAVSDIPFLLSNAYSRNCQAIHHNK